MRISTSGAYASILNNLMSAQQRQADAGEHMSAQKLGTDLKAYSRDTQVLTAMQSLDVRYNGFIDQNKQVKTRLEVQDLGLTQAAEVANNVRLAIANALASDSAVAFMTQMRTQFSTAIGALNSQVGGKYVFAGGQVDTPPNSATKMEDLTVGPTAVADSFKNDEYIEKVRVDESTTLEIGQIASKIGTGMLTAFRDIQAFHQGPNGPFAGPLTAAQRTFLQSQIPVWDSVHKGLLNDAARNGQMQSQLDAADERLDDRQVTIGGILIDIKQSSEQDLAKVATVLSEAQLAVQASSQVFLTLKNASLLNYLR
ncbi:MAG: flagellin [Phenylobacterium sp.]